MSNKDTINIMPDYGMAPYAWLRRAGQTRGVGGNIADAICGFPEEYGVSEGLEKAFANWACYFERNVEPGRDENFDWETFHRRGRELTRRLKEEIGDKFYIHYVIPYEDPETERQRDYCRATICYLIEKIKEQSLAVKNNVKGEDSK